MRDPVQSPPRAGYLDPPFLAEPWGFIDTDRLMSAGALLVAVTINGKELVPDGKRAELTSIDAWCWPNTFTATTAAPTNQRVIVTVRRNGVAIPGTVVEAGRMLVGRYAPDGTPLAGICCAVPQLYRLRSPVHVSDTDSLQLLLQTTAGGIGVMRSCVALSGWLYPAPHEVPGEAGTHIR